MEDAEICRRNGWRKGTLLVGDEGYGPTVIRLTAIGESDVLARRVLQSGKTVDDNEGHWILTCRNWRRYQP